MQLCEWETDFESILGERTPIFVYFKGSSALFSLDTQLTTDHTRGRRPDGWQDWRRPGDDPPPTLLRPSKGSGVAQCRGGQDQGRARGSGVGQSQPGGAASNGRERSEGKYYWEDQRSHQARVDLAAFGQHPKTSFENKGMEPQSRCLYLLHLEVNVTGESDTVYCRKLCIQKISHAETFSLSRRLSQL